MLAMLVSSSNQQTPESKSFDFKSHRSAKYVIHKFARKNTDYNCGLLNIFEKFGEIGIYGLIYHKKSPAQANKIKEFVIKAFRSKLLNRNRNVTWTDFLREQFHQISKMMPQEIYQHTVSSGEQVVLPIVLVVDGNTVTYAQYKRIRPAIMIAGGSQLSKINLYDEYVSSYEEQIKQVQTLGRSFSKVGWVYVQKNPKYIVLQTEYWSTEPFFQDLSKLVINKNLEESAKTLTTTLSDKDMIPKDQQDNVAIVIVFKNQTPKEVSIFS